MLPLASLSGGSGGLSTSSSATATVGDTASGAGSVNVGGFNVPAAPGTVSGTQITIIAVAIIAGLLVMKLK